MLITLLLKTTDGGDDGFKLMKLQLYILRFFLFKRATWLGSILHINR
jgi:hypothetical protein